MAPAMRLVLLALLLSQAALAAAQEWSSPSPLPPGGPSSAPSPFPGAPFAPDAPGPLSPFHSPPAPPADDGDLPPDVEPPAPSAASPSPLPASPSQEPSMPSDVHAPAPSEEDRQKVDEAASLAAHSEPSGGGEGGMSGGRKVGLAVGVIMAAAVVGVGAFVYKKRRDNVRRSQYGLEVRREML